MSKFKLTFKGMTLIEIIVTIVIFGVGILTILSVLTGSLSLGRRSRNKTTATMLAKEGLEMVFNMRDTNLDKALPRGCLNDGECATFNLATLNGTFLVDRNPSTGTPMIYRTISASGDANRRIYSTGDTVIRYTHRNENGSQPTSFSRWIVIEPAQHLGDDSSFVNSQIKKVTSVVEYEQLGGTSRVELESFIGLTR